MRYGTLSSAWKKLWPECVPGRVIDGFETASCSARHKQKIADHFTIIDDIVTIGQNIGLEIEADDIEELLEDHCIELTTEELEHLQNEQERNWLIKLKKKNRTKKMSQVL